MTKSTTNKKKNEKKKNFIQMGKKKKKERKEKKGETQDQTERLRSQYQLCQLIAEEPQAKGVLSQGSSGVHR